MTNINIFLISFLNLILLVINTNVSAGNVLVDRQTQLVDGTLTPYNRLVPGDTLFLSGGTRDYLIIRNFQGTAAQPITMMNKEGLVVIDTEHTFGISIQNCRYFRLTGTGLSSAFYGIAINRVAKGAGLGIGSLSSDYEIDHISIKDVPIGGIFAKTDPDCSTPSTRDKFVQYNTVIHDCYIENSGNEGMYIGSTKYFGQVNNFSGKDTLLMPSVLMGVRIYNNIVKYAGWDGIQVSSANSNCQVYNNIILYDSQAEYPNQMSGIILGGGSRCDCYNNYIADGKGDGIENHGLGSNKIFNNIIVNAGASYAPNDFSAAKMKHGIFLSDISTLNDSAIYIQHNTIVNPKSDGIRFSSTKSKNNLIASNAIINPGNFDYYENGNTQFKGINSYVMVPDKTSSLLIASNYFSRDFNNAAMNNDYSLRSNSPLIDAGYSLPPRIGFDFKYHIRKNDNTPDIGAYEYEAVTGIKVIQENTMRWNLYPNPVVSAISLEFDAPTSGEIAIFIYDMKGNLLQEASKEIIPAGMYARTINVNQFPAGIYLYTILLNKRPYSGKFVKISAK